MGWLCSLGKIGDSIHSIFSSLIGEAGPQAGNR